MSLTSCELKERKNENRSQVSNSTIPISALKLIIIRFKIGHTYIKTRIGVEFQTRL